jgi:hypothetical protein
MSKQQHPDADELARFQAGEIGGLRGRQLAAHIADCAHCASVSDDLAAVSRVLASVATPSMPDAVESRITAAIAAEAATRQAASPAAASATAAAGAPGAAAAAAAAGSPADSTAASPAASEERSRRLRSVHSDKSKSHARGFRPAMAVLSAAACLVLVGFGYLLSRTGSSSSSASTSAAAPAALPAGAAAGAAASGHAAASSAASGFAAQRSSGQAVSPSASAQRPQEGQQAMPFLVTKSGTDYKQATLAAQVRGELNRKSKPSGTGRQSSGGSGGLPPSQPLIGCVENVTRNVPPKLVDQATYEGKAVYVIAVSDHAWVVGPGCTASNSDLIASVALPG